MANSLKKYKFVLFLALMIIVPFFSLINAKTIVGTYNYYFHGETIAESIEINIFGGGYFTIYENDDLGIKYERNAITWKTKPIDNSDPNGQWRIDIRWNKESSAHQLLLDIDSNYSYLSDRGDSSIYFETRMYYK